MSTKEVRWTPYRLQEIRDCWVSTWHGFIAYFDVTVWVHAVYSRTPYPISKAHRPTNNRMYVASSHLLTETWTSVPAISPIDLPMPDRALLDLIASETRREDVGKEEKFDRIADLLSRHYRVT
ncbi:hypothetical protein M9H77_23800 [Catharanthus roseus]|uniref:Uncharacterized protein n=1 Tax=Catharanthus roseus TaxID=4058 RepID=A0ACC0AVK4_CATRO|nr:hypothetical protein M9H77_23800 [Catharanthus roseus]